ncbi:hypothetical protein ACJJTC_014499 [Scirpophaga incertulas]
MENLFKNQTEIYDTLQKLLTNIKKDGNDRKNEDYCKRKIDLLESYWSDYQQNHRKLCAYADFNHVYFTEHYFDTAEELYNTSRDLLYNLLQQLSEQPEGKPTEQYHQVISQKDHIELPRPGPSGMQKNEFKVKLTVKAKFF